MTDEVLKHDKIPRILFLLETVEGNRVIPTSFLPSEKKIVGFIDDYNVSGDSPLPDHIWSLSDGSCDSGKQQHALKDNDVLHIAKRLPTL